MANVQRMILLLQVIEAEEEVLDGQDLDIFETRFLGIGAHGVRRQGDGGDEHG